MAMLILESRLAEGHDVIKRLITYAVDKRTRRKAGRAANPLRFDLRYGGLIKGAMAMSMAPNRWVSQWRRC